MKRIDEFIGKSLKWEQPNALKMEYELHVEDETIATLKFRSSFGSFAVAECGSGCWTFKRVGFFKTRITIRPCSSENEIAVFKNNTWKGGGSLEFGDGRKLLANTNFWQTNYEFKTESGEQMISFKPGGFLHMSAVVNIQPNAARLQELPLLVILGWYLAILLHNDSSAAAAAAAA